MRVFKFGGSSLADTERIATVLDIIDQAREAGEIAVVVSAMGGVTDALEKVARTAAMGGEIYREACREIEGRHLDVVKALASPEDQDELRKLIKQRTEELESLLHGVSLVRECSPRVRDRIRSYGERICASLVAAGLRSKQVRASFCDACNLVVTDRHFGSARVEYEETERRIQAHFQQCSEIQVVTGFIGHTREGEITTLGRGGSDLTASLLGAALKAEAVEIWTDVDGVMSADPRLVPSAFPLERLTYDELMELSHFGAKVVYPPSVHPARRGAIPLLIRNTFNRSFPGTAVVPRAGKRRHLICGIASIDDVALLRLQGDGMVGIPGTASRLFGALAKEGVSVTLISQASSEHSICFALDPADVAVAGECIEEEFLLERRVGLIDDLVVEDDLSIIAAVGEAMRRRPGLARRLFDVLGREGVNIRAIAQGSSELNISVVVSRRDVTTALNSIHDSFFSNRGSLVRVFVAGTGRVGGALLEQMENLGPQIEQRRGVRIKLAGVTNRRRMRLGRGGKPAASLSKLSRGEPAQGDQAADLGTLVAAIEATPGRRIFVDCTAGDAVPGTYARLMAAGVPVVTANKRPLAGALHGLQELYAAAETGRVGLYHDTTVGAGLPVLHTLRSMVETGDELMRIEGTLSGSISCLLNRLSQGEPFSRVVRFAHDEGLTEPDPREDLAGRDVARKLLILARTAGWKMELEDLEVESLLPDSFMDMDLSTFWEQLPEVDRAYEDRLANCSRQGKILCYLASLEPGKAQVRLQALDPLHPCATIRGTDNLIAFHTSRYAVTPLVIRGPGAGPEVTAAGVMEDLLKAAADLGACCRPVSGVL
ncbi:MAG: bifunctional aspartate kinase/homoserine dehydrogenase I [Acidobacteriota bacterium]